MKKYWLILLGFSSAGFAQITVPQTTRTFYGITEATWCGLCGQYGIPATNDIMAASGSKAVYVALHQSATSALHSPTAAQLAGAFSMSGQPLYTLNGNSIWSHSSTIVSDLSLAIADYYMATGTAVNAGFEYGIVGDSIYVNTKTTFFQQLTGEYNLGIYIYEDSIWEWQANYDPGIPDMDIWHNHVLRTSFGGHFGELIATGTIAAGTSINRNVKMALDPAWNVNHLKVFTVIWEKTEVAYKAVNANDAGGTITGHAGLEADSDPQLNVYPNPAAHMVSVSGLEITPETQLVLFDMQGNIACTVTGGSSIDLSNLADGPYMLRIIHQGKIYQRSIIKNL